MLERRVVCALALMSLSFACGRGVSEDPLGALRSDRQGRGGTGEGAQPPDGGGEGPSNGGARGGTSGSGGTGAGTTGEGGTGAGTAGEGGTRAGTTGEGGTAAGTGAVTGTGGAVTGTGGAVTGTGGAVTGTGGADTGTGGTSAPPQGGAPPDGDPLGSPCTTGGDCASGVCMPDVERNRRCCEADCLASGRACSTDGECICVIGTREVDGVCLLVEGKACRDHLECASNKCVDKVCCDVGCADVCERCDAPDHVGTCSEYDEDPACTARTGFECTARGRCRLPLGSTCGTDSDCESDQCEPTAQHGQVCCERACTKDCQRCSPNGRCDGYPEHDDAACTPVVCPEKTICLDYRIPEPHACSGHGQCAACERLPARNGIPCGPGEQCDGNGSCVFTGIGTVAAGLKHTCAIRDNGNVVCWGFNEAGQLGAVFDRTYVGMTEEPAAVQGLEIDFPLDVFALTAGFAHTCALLENNRVRCWGRMENELVYGTVNGVLGTAAIVRNDLGFVDPLSTGDVQLPGPAVQISAATGGAHICALLASGAVVCWGYNRYGQCGNGTTVEVAALPNQNLTPVALPELAIEVRAAAGHTCALLESGGVMCWGSGSGGCLGYGDATDRVSPRDYVEFGGIATRISTSASSTCAVLEGGRLRCWGGNRDGELGYGHTLLIGDDETPEEAATLPGPPGRTYLGGDAPIGGGNVVQIVNTVDSRGTCARFDGGAVRCWGTNNRGQLGYGHAQLRGRQETPAELAGRPAGTRLAGGDIALGGPVLALAEGGRCALRVDGALFCWGDNEDAELGLPAQVPRGSMTLTPIEMGPVNWR